MADFSFTFDISGKCEVLISAESKAEALKKFNNGDFTSELNEWDINLPYNFNPDVDDLMRYCSNKNEVEKELKVKK